ncbi:MAG: MFS transporter [Actinomycetota bacterium]
MIGRDRIFEGWYVVGAVFVVLMVNAGLGFYGLAVYLEAITEEQGFSTTSVSFATSLFFIVGAITGRAVAPVIQRRDLRIVVGAGGVVSAVGLVLVGRATSLPALYAAYVVFAVGFGLSGLVPATTLVTRWFEARRSVALSIGSTGLSVGGLTFTVLAAALIDRWGMRDATPWLAIIYIVVIGLALIALWPDPAERGQVPDGIVSEKAVTEAPAGWTYEDAARTWFFRLTTAGFVLAMAAQVGGIAQLAKLGSERVDGATGTLLVSTVAGSSVVARLIGGVVATKVQLVVMTAVLALGQGGALLLMSGADSRLTLVVTTLLFGATIGNLLMLQPLVLADRFGVTEYPKIYSVSQLIVTGLGVAGGPYLLGWLRDAESYRTSYSVAAMLSLAGGVVFFAAWHVDRRSGVEIGGEAGETAVDQANVRSA